MPVAALLLGSNLGEREKNIGSALELIEKRTGRIIKSSNIYRTEPWGLKEQPEFLNQAVLVETKLEPYQLLETLLQIEIESGRVRHEQWASRSLDIDILYYDAFVVNEPNLKVPHPFLQERRFSLAPLCEISKDWVHPVLNQNVAEMLENCPDKGRVEAIHT